jgi:hypothetical protein
VRPLTTYSRAKIFCATKYLLLYEKKGIKGADAQVAKIIPYTSEKEHGMEQNPFQKECHLFLENYIFFMTVYNQEEPASTPLHSSPPSTLHN